MNFSRLKALLVLVLSWTAATQLLADQNAWKAGVARAVITPEQPMWLAGYASRTKPAEGKVMDLWLKVLALEDARGHKGVWVSTDTLGIPQSIYREVCAGLKEKYGLEPDQVVLSASHTHCGPVLRASLSDIYPLDDRQRALIEQYSVGLKTKIIEATGKALAALAPARLAVGQGSAGFAVNRRNNSEKEVPRLIQEGALKGPVDHSVPVLTVLRPDGQLEAVLFGYACHNTTMDFYQWSGDYAGFAQLALEKSHPGTTAMFFMGCGADQNPLPRRQPELAERYGHMLAAAVEEALLLPQKSLAPELKTSLEMVSLKLGPAPTAAELEKQRSEGAPHIRRWAARLLEETKAGKPLARAYPFPLQAWRLGGTQLMITLGGEPVVDWPLKFKAAFGPQTWVAGYCNDVMAYIPSLRVLNEGGYEGGTSMIAYGMPALAWDKDIEQVLDASARRLVERVTK